MPIVTLDPITDNAKIEIFTYNFMLHCKFVFFCGLILEGYQLTQASLVECSGSSVSVLPLVEFWKRYLERSGGYTSPIGCNRKFVFSNCKSGQRLVNISNYKSPARLHAG